VYYSTELEQTKVTMSCLIDPATIIMKLNGKKLQLGGSVEKGQKPKDNSQIKGRWRLSSHHHTHLQPK
jgi:hypothetical protein